MGTPVDMNEFVAGFLLEADEHLHSINRNLVAVSEALKQMRLEPRAVRELFRSLHTIKGLSSMVGAEPIVDLSHEMEGILRTADRAGGQLSESTLDLLVKGTRAIEELVGAISKEGVSGLPKAPSELIYELAHSQNLKLQSDARVDIQLSLSPEILSGLSVADREQIIQAEAAGKRAVSIEFQPSAEKAARGINISAVRENIKQLGEIVKVVPLSSKTAPTGISFTILLITSSSDEQIKMRAGLEDSPIQFVHTVKSQAIEETRQLLNEMEADEWSTRDQSSIRVDVRRLDDALERLSELVVTRAKLARAASDLTARGVDTRELNAIVAENTRQLKRLRAAITEARMVPLSEFLQRLPLVVRGLTKNTDKSVDMKIQAGSAEVDKAVADKILPAVVHVIRNAVDHAIESRQERLGSNKLETGTISVYCDDSSGTNLTLTISDDGRGIDREAVARKIGQSVARNDEELLQQICSPGLSTKDDVTHTSGRGMGMDIVKRTIEMLGGTLSLSTTKGKGTTFTFRVPVSITIVDVLSFISGSQTFVAPVAMVDEIIEIDPSHLVKSPVPSQQGPHPHLIERRGETIPLLSLDAVLKGRPDLPLPTRALVVNQHKGTIAFAVDRMLGQQEVVVRPLDENLIKIVGMAGATDLGDGRPTLVLDLASLGTAIMENAG